jgi:hypothetical protein
MTMPKSRKHFSPEGRNYINAADRIERWQLCQKIGVVFYEAEISYERLLQLKEYFLTSDFIKGGRS